MKKIVIVLCPLPKVVVNYTSANEMTNSQITIDNTEIY